MTALIEDPLTFALTALTERLAEQYADLPFGAVVRVVAAARVGTESAPQPIVDTVENVERVARADLDRIRARENADARKGIVQTPGI